MDLRKLKYDFMCSLERANVLKYVKILFPGLFGIKHEREYDEEFEEFRQDPFDLEGDLQQELDEWDDED